MNVWLIVGVVIAVLVVVAVILEGISARAAKRDQEEFDKLSSGEKWKLQQEARKQRYL